jgi:hypothetical protein
VTGTSARWLAFAAIGLLVAVAVAVLATRLVSEKIGITGEPVNAVSSLAPEAVSQPQRPHGHHATIGVTSVTTTPASPPPAPSGTGSAPAGERTDGSSASGERTSGDHGGRDD